MPAKLVTVVHKVTGYIETVPERYFETLKHLFRLAEDADHASARAVDEAALAPAVEAPAVEKEG